MFGLEPLSRPVAITEILLLLALAAFVGWLLGRLVLAGRIKELDGSLLQKQDELDKCRWAVPPVSQPVQPARVAPVGEEEVKPSFVHADPLLPAIAPEETAEPIPVVPPIPVPEEPVRPPVSAPPVAEPARVTAASTSETAVLSRIAARANEVNFGRIGTATAAEADDLKEIVGIGPFLERKLHSLGIYTFRQVAKFSKEDIDKVNELIEFFPGRIERDNWVDQAKTFHEKKYGA